MESWDILRPKLGFLRNSIWQLWPLDWSLFYLTGHFDRPHLYAFRWNFKSTSEEEEGGEQSDDEEAMQEGSD